MDSVLYKGGVLFHGLRKKASMNGRHSASQRGVEVVSDKVGSRQSRRLLVIVKLVESLGYSVGVGRPVALSVDPVLPGDLQTQLSGGSSIINSRLCVRDIMIIRGNNNRHGVQGDDSRR